MKEKISFISMFDKLTPDKKDKSGVAIFFPLLLFFVISVAYFYFFGSVLLFHQENNMLFVFSADYILNFIDKPGGMLIYSGNFLTQFYFNPLIGSIIISILLVLISIVLNGISRSMGVGRTFSLLFVLLPSASLMLMQSRYDFQVYHILGFLLILAWFRISIAAVNPFIRLALIALFPLLYYLTGSFVFVYLGLYITYSFLYQKGNSRYFLISSLAAIALITFFVFKNYLFFQPGYKLLAFPLYLNFTLRLTIFLGFFSGFIILFPLLIKTACRVSLTVKMERFIRLSPILIMFPASIFILIRNYDSEKASVMKFEKLVFMQEWDEVIRQHEKLNSANIVEQYYYNLALSEEGQLCNRMFFGRQSHGSMALTLKRDDDQSYRAIYFYYAVGLTGEAHHLAFEQVVQHGYRPENIKMLIKTELINGNFKIAERYINVLKGTLHYKNWVRKYEKMLFKPDIVNSDPELGEKIRLLPKEDFYIVADDFRNLEMLLQVNTDNRIAFEYKIARLLLEKDLMAVGSEVKRLKGMGYGKIPRHIEEAVVSLVNVTKEFPDLGGLAISNDTDQRFIKYFSDLKSFKGDRSLIEKGINKTDKNTFWYYLQFGLIKSDLFKSSPVDNSIY